MSRASPIEAAEPRPWLDVARASAALLVLASHVRSLTVLDAADQLALSLPGRLMFAATGLGHEAVIVFFVLSGFLVTRAMLRLRRAGAWSLTRFGVERLVRLWVVLAPCLVLGGVLDAAGLWVASARDGTTTYGHLAATAAPLARDTTTGIGNLLFLQTIVVPVWGSNGPLWSLAAEAWFYALAALLFSSWCDRRRSHAPVPLLVAMGLLLALPGHVLVFLPVWLLGAGCAVLGGREPRRGTGPTAGVMAAACFVAVLAASRGRLVSHPVARDWLLGLAAAWLLLCAARWPWRARWWSRSLRGLSAASYSLYLSHVPVLALLGALTTGSRRSVLGAGSCALMLVEALVALVCAAALWWGFERHTPALRRLALGLAIGHGRRRVAAVAAGEAAP